MNGKDIGIVGVQAEAWSQNLRNDPPLSHADSSIGTRSGHAFTNHQPATSPDSLIGVVVRRAGLGRGIPNPLRGRRLTSVHIANAEREGWHVMFVTSPDTAQDAFELDSAEIWYGIFDGVRWHGPDRVAVARHAALANDFAPDLVVDDGDVAFAYPIQTPGAERIILLHRRRGRWGSDTLWIHAMTTYVRVMKDPRAHRWLVASTHEQLASRAGAANGLMALYLAAFDSTWGTERIIALPERTSGVVAPLLLASGRELLAIWVAETETQPRVPFVRIAPVVAGAQSEPTGSAVVQRDVDELAGISAVELSGGEVVLLLGPRQSPESVSLTIRRHGTLAHLGSLPIAPDMNPMAIAIAPREIGFFTDRWVTNDSEPPASTVFNQVSVTCRQGP